MLTASNIILKKMKPNRWLPFIVGTWGVVTTLSGLVQNFGGLVAIRLMLGLCEGGLLPGMVTQILYNLSGEILTISFPDFIFEHYLSAT